MNIGSAGKYTSSVRRKPTVFRPTDRLSYWVMICLTKAVKSGDVCRLYPIASASWNVRSAVQPCCLARLNANSMANPRAGRAVQQVRPVVLLECHLQIIDLLSRQCCFVDWDIDVAHTAFLDQLRIWRCRLRRHAQINHRLNALLLRFLQILFGWLRPDKKTIANCLIISP